MQTGTPSSRSHSVSCWRSRHNRIFSWCVVMPFDLDHEPAKDRDSIIVRGKEYVYIETAQKDVMEKTRRIKMENGRKVHFVPVRGTKFLRVYISSEFYPGMCKVKYPIHGRGML